MTCTNPNNAGTSRTILLNPFDHTSYSGSSTSPKISSLTQSTNTHFMRPYMIRDSATHYYLDIRRSDKKILCRLKSKNWERDTRQEVNIKVVLQCTSCKCSTSLQCNWVGNSSIDIQRKLWMNTSKISVTKLKSRKVRDR